jgi:hypothetical protein
LKTKQVIIETAEESIGYKKRKNRKWLRTWNDEIKLAIEEKKTSFEYIYKTKQWNTLLNTKSNEQW